MKPEGLRKVSTRDKSIFEQILARTGRADKNRPSRGQNGQRGIDADNPDTISLEKSVGDEGTVNLERDGETPNLRLSLTLASSQRFCLSVCCLSVYS